MNTIPVIIPVYGRENVFATPRRLRAYASPLRFLVIDNGNAPGLAQRLAALAGADCEVIRFEENRGGSAAYIAGMKRAMELEGDFVWLLDDDAEPNERTLPQLVKAMELCLSENQKTASVGSAVIGVEHPGIITECGAFFSPLFGHAKACLGGKRLSDVGDRIVNVDYSAACSLLVNKAAVRECGFWEDVFIHFDDIEWGLRVRRAGWRNCATTASTVVHPDFHGYDEKRCWMTYFDARNKYWLAAKYGPVHVALARFKNYLFDLRARRSGRLLDSIIYRRLAWLDYRAGIRRTRVEVVTSARARLF